MYDSIFQARFYIWGIGNTTKELWKYLGPTLSQLDIVGYIDNKYVGGEYKGKNVYAPNILMEDRDAYLIIINSYRNEILEQIYSDFPWYQERIFGEEIIKRLLIITRYAQSNNDEVRAFLNYIEHNQLKSIGNEFIEEYEKRQYSIEFDCEKGLFYVWHGKYKMFFSKSYRDIESANTYYKYLCAEQDQRSPHCYMNAEFCVESGDVVVDAGGAEGNFALSVVERAKKIYIFEPDLDWVEALQYTFEPFKDKVVIVPNILSDYSGTTLDSYIPVGEKINFIKMDIEGEEYHAIMGAQRVIEESDKLECAICTYHQELAYDIIKSWFEKNGFKTEHTNGFMWFDSECNLYKAPVLRRGVIRAKKWNNRVIR